MINPLLGTLATVAIWWMLAVAQSMVPLPGVQLSSGWRIGGGMVFLFDGVITMVWSISVLASALKEKRLALTGPFAYVRHPLYGSLLYSGTAGMAFAWSSWLVLLAVVPLSVMWTLIADREEADLLHTFGEQYAHYKSETGQLFPDFLRAFTSGNDRHGAQS